MMRSEEKCPLCGADVAPELYSEFNTKGGIRWQQREYQCGYRETNLNNKGWSFYETTDQCYQNQINAANARIAELEQQVETLSEDNRSLRARVAFLEGEG